jgi:hypothetical protein
MNAVIIVVQIARRQRAGLGLRRQRHGNMRIGIGERYQTLLDQRIPEIAVRLEQLELVRPVRAG